MRPVIPALLLSLFLTSTLQATDTKKGIDLPQPQIKPAVVEPTVVDPTVVLSTGQWYVIGSDQPLVVDQVSKDGEVSISTSRKSTLTLPSAWVVGRAPDADDPEFCTITNKHLYVVKAKTTGVTTLLINRTTNDVDATTKLPVPFTSKDFVKVTINVKAGQAPQPPPKPVDPVNPVDPAPKPVDPPKPVSPIAADGLHVLITYDDGVPLSEDQWAIITGTEVRQALNAQCASPASWQMWKSNTDVSTAQKFWQDAFNRKKTSQPWVVIGNNKNPLGGYEGPLPPNKTEFLALLKKYGGK